MTHVAFDIPVDLMPYVQTLQADLWNELGGEGPLPPISEALLWWLRKEQDQQAGAQEYARRQAVIERLNPSEDIPF